MNYSQNILKLIFNFEYIFECMSIINLILNTLIYLHIIYINKTIDKYINK